ncbi:MAG: transposase [Leptospiraceae bacterium]|nr:transposase [Leptospiraceae bacterium]
MVHEHLFLLKQGLECWEFYQSKVKECDTEIEKLLNELTKDKDKHDSLNHPKKINSHNKPEIEDLHGKLLMLTNGVDISVLPGLSDLSFMQIISELGINMDRWKSSKHFVSWLNLAPSISSSGKSKKKKKKKGFNYAGQIFREAAMRGGNSKFLSISSFYKRIRARSVAKVANVATARKIAVLFYNLLKHGLNYVEEGIEKAEMKFRERSIKSMEKRALDLGLTVIFQTIK